MTYDEQRIIQVCAQCGSDDVVSDASARWSVEEQDWVLSDVQDGTYCEQCGGECRLDEKPFTSRTGYLAQLPLVNALWWVIDNFGAMSTTEFADATAKLRARVRVYNTEKGDEE